MNSLIQAAVLLAVLSSAWAQQISLAQSGAEVKRPGDAAKLRCTVSGFNVASTSMYWIRQAPGKGLDLIIYYYSDSYKNYYPKISGRFTASKDSSSFYIHMTDLKAEDTAVYYCARDGDSGALDYWGPGTLVTVTSAAAQAPSVYPLISPGASLDSVVIGCLAIDFLPDSVTFDWTDKNNASFSTGLAKFPSVTTGGLYTASTRVKVPSESWKNRDPYYCKVTHPSLGQPLTKKVQFSVQRISKPTVTLHAPAREDIINNNATIVCICRGFHPQPISIKWMKNGKDVTSGIYTEEPVADTAGNFDVTSLLSIEPTDWNMDTVYSCVVDHTASKFWNTRNMSKSMLCDAQVGPVKVTAFTVAPTFEDMFESKSAKLTCIVTNMGTIEGLNITWSREDTNEVLKTEITTPIFHDNATLSVMGIATVCADQWDAHHKFVCKVLHQDLAEQRVLYLQKPNGNQRRKPSVYIYPPPSEELALKETATIVCLMRGYSPCDPFVRWLENSQQLQKEDYVNTKQVEEVDPTTGQNSCFMYSMLKTTAAQWTAGNTYTCVVGHEALPLQITQKSIDKSFVRALYIDEEEDLENIWSTTSTFIILFLLSIFYSATVTLFKVKYT